MQSENLTVKYLNKSKIIKLDPFMLYLQVTPLKSAEAVTINCIIVKHALTLFYQLKPDTQLALYGHYNARHQFVITKFMVRAAVQTLAS
ncbi:MULTISPECIES: hypothetical protein [Lactiplantibacillus]|uniref:Uncharacterized protein n=1 Tax=Lactiplantibacillus paraplantarum TaxID=60520 RepID=A0A2I9DQC8_9LACO|nr:MULTISPECIES: hypothetical protein [Lactiplantibacillus]AVW09783.1 hypothetical protein DA077_04140 [Lactiplantibacillus paraplantarum]AYJ37995.1 hypothetical protein LP667_03740 [Lactiplantibacillus paraplantarum]ERL45579.1 hypothetical protein N644_0401 [Lactiplantibacillus paraplantarum]KRL50216.1 hypothetical protein FD48_GL002782 [Lactiplantibacillus paraplantarum DSM 10667]MCU4682959.1 hypothetical protein [Lactiplantibacillus paraplantarum]